MECEVCLEELDLKEKRPKFLPCGHTVCQRCVRRLRDRLCPQCRKALPKDLSTLPDNYYVIGQLQHAAQKSSSRSWWCVNCNQIASLSCEECHTVQSMKAALRTQTEAILPKASKELEAAMKCLQNCSEDRAPNVLKVLSQAEAVGSSWHLTLKCNRGRSSYTAQLETSAFGNILKALFMKKTIEGSLPTILNLEPKQSHLSQTPSCSTLHLNQEEGAKPRIDNLNIKLNSLSGPSERLESKSHWLSSVKSRGVRRIRYVHCHCDPEWTLQILRASVPTVEVAELFHPGTVHLTAVLTAPHLKRLSLVNTAIHDTLYRDPPMDELAVLGYNTIEHLSVSGDRGLPRETLLALLCQHSASLQELHLEVGTSRNGPGTAGPVPIEAWPRKCANLDDMLVACGLTALKKLVLLRNMDDDNAELDHSQHHCKKQLDKLRKVLPGAEVLCQSIKCVAAV
ncbi:E3 ubiquitin-protein ligase SH3RF1 [Frankliniella fusca]|uniref:E3 ubiquitin-protein ligase SH3RF1 n=1 Tax=Frankliniella fusca TaxID=407009 RepID=A0AAE1LBQ7_9NEOP|nr:E3 ubiquitin-protein ligase SH3RF1 [Frankliniella fusca]